MIRCGAVTEGLSGCSLNKHVGGPRPGIQPEAFVRRLTRSHESIPTSLGFSKLQRVEREADSRWVRTAMGRIW